MEDGTLTEKQLRWVTNIRASGEKLMGLITDILDLAKIEAGKMGVRTEEFKPVDVCEGVLSMFRPIAERKALDLRGEIDALQGLKVRQDIGKIQQILSNLVSNAIKFTPQGGTVSLRGRSEKDLVIFEVEDTGVGIAEDEQELVFDKFRQTANPMTRDYSGTGLGLSIVRELTRILGGEVQLQSELGKGSIFIIRLPMILPGDSQYEITLVGDIDLTRAQRIDARLLASGSRDQPAN